MQNRIILAFLLVLHLVNGSVADEMDEHAADDSFFLSCVAILASLVIGAVGILPLCIVPLDAKLDENGTLSGRLRILLGFACGSLLSDVFLHILPEAFKNAQFLAKDETHAASVYVGLWVIVGIISFLTLEKLVLVLDAAKDGDIKVEPSKENLCSHESPGQAINYPSTNSKEVQGSVNPAGYLNLLVNTLDNFAHGLTVAASFGISMKVGLLTTLAIIVHEIPHEIGDLAILIRAGFNKHDAIKAQLFTSTGGVLGTICGLLLDQTGRDVEWILPFSAGGFIYIALVSLVPDLLRNEHGLGLSGWLPPIAAVLAGVVFVGCAISFESHPM